MIKKKGPFRGLTTYFFFALGFSFFPLGFLSNFLFAAARVFIPCLSAGFIQPQVAHTTSSSFVGQRSQSLLASRLCLHQAYFAYLLKVTSFPYKTYRYRKYRPFLTWTLGLCQNLARPSSYHIHMLRTFTCSLSS